MYLKEVPQVLLFTELLLVIDRKILTLVFLADFELRQDRETAFVSSFVDVHEMAMNRKVLSVEARSPQLYYGFFRNFIDCSQPATGPKLLSLSLQMS